MNTKVAEACIFFKMPLTTPVPQNLLTQRGLVFGQGGGGTFLLISHQAKEGTYLGLLIPGAMWWGGFHFEKNHSVTKIFRIETQNGNFAI